MSAADCQELVRTLTPLLLAGMEAYENSLSARFKTVEGMLTAIPRLDEENKRLKKENQALRQAVEKLLAK